MFIGKMKLSKLLMCLMLTGIVLLSFSFFNTVEAKNNLNIEGFANTLEHQTFGGRLSYWGEEGNFWSAVEADTDGITGGQAMVGISIFENLMPATSSYLQAGYGYREYPDAVIRGTQIGAAFLRSIGENINSRTYLRLGIYPDEYDLYYRTGFNITMTDVISLNIDLTGYTMDRSGLEIGIQLEPGGMEE